MHSVSVAKKEEELIHPKNLQVKEETENKRWVGMTMIQSIFHQGMSTDIAQKPYCLQTHSVITELLSMPT